MCRSHPIHVMVNFFQTRHCHRELTHSERWAKHKTSAIESLYDGLFTFSTQLIIPDHLVILPDDLAPQFLSKLTTLNTALRVLERLTGKLPKFLLVRDIYFPHSLLRLIIVTTHSSIITRARKNERYTKV